jgi:predicted phosphodiesterase
MLGGLSAGSGAAAAGSAELGRDSPAAAAKPKLRIGLVTDIHYADRPPAGSRHYRETLGRLQEAVDTFNQRGIDVALELGDLIDAADDVPTELRYLDAADRVFRSFRGDRRYVLGNHCVWTLSKAQFLQHVGAASAHYSFDRSGVHFVVLDACYRADGTPYGDKNYEWTDTEIPPVQRQWLRNDLERASAPTLVFVHQRLDVENHYGVRSAPEVRRLLEESGKVLAVFQGHSHQNDHRRINGIHYCTLAAVVEGAGQSNAYGILTVLDNGALTLEGFHRQQNRAF